MTKMKLPKLSDPASPAQPPKSLWEKVLTYSPVVMTVIATLLAGMSNSELSAAQYERAAAAQHQSKAGDQWSYFQAKKLRGLSMDNTLEVLRSASDAGRFDPAALLAFEAVLSESLKSAAEGAKAAAKQPASGSDAKQVEALIQRLDEAAATTLNACAPIRDQLASPKLKDALAQADSGPPFTPAPIQNNETKAATSAIAAAAPDEEVNPLVRRVEPKLLADALRTAQENTVKLDAITGPAGKILDALHAQLANQASAAASCTHAASELETALGAGRHGSPLFDAMNDLTAQFEVTAATLKWHSTALAAARLQFGARRYAAEASLNQDLALLTEIRVHQANIEAEHHRTRSRMFFVGTLIAQAAVIGATLALAMKQKNILWALAAVAGIAAISFGVYVRLYV